MNELVQGLKRLADQSSKTMIFTATILRVNEDEDTVDVVDQEGVEYFDVRLRAAIDSSQAYSVSYPKIHSSVLVGNIGLSETALFLVAANEIDKCVIDLVGTKIVVDQDGLIVERNGISIKNVLLNLIAAIEKLTVNAAGAPSSVPINISEFTALRTPINQIFK
ncbi:MAG: hypothetical protein AAF242_00040 [Bacteroidota bacterium]